MGTCNFRTQKHFDDYCYISECLSEEEQKQFKQDNGYDYDWEQESYFDYQDLDMNFKYVLEEVNKEFNLQLFTFELASGYYDGVQLIVKSDISGLDVDDIADTDYIKENWDNDDCRYYFGHIAEYKSTAILKIKQEINKINKKVLPYIAERTGMKKFDCIGVFSNGEALYRYAA